LVPRAKGEIRETARASNPLDKVVNLKDFHVKVAQTPTREIEAKEC
jgi:hypothetical protein